MNWKIIKTIFIFTFLILNIYLGREFYAKAYQKFEPLPEDTLKEQKINYNKSFEQVDEKLPLVSGTSKSFSKEMLEEFKKKNANQEIGVVSNNQTVVNVKLKDPYKLPQKGEELEGQLNNFVKEYIPNSDHFEYWKHDEKRHRYLFRQTENDYPFYFGDKEFVAEGNLTGIIEVLTNEKNEVTQYRITEMKIKTEGKKQEIITAQDALKALNLPGGTNLKDVKLVYFTLLTDEGWKVFVPSWHIVTESEEFMVGATKNDTTVIKLTNDEVDDENQESGVE